jgi:hypothetical protein
VTFEEFVKAMTKELYVFRMADRNLNRNMLASRETRLTRVRRRIDDAVLQRALTITDERRCAAVSRHPADGKQYRCEYDRGHEPVLGRTRGWAEDRMHEKAFDHGTPSKGLWWMDA